VGFPQQLGGQRIRGKGLFFGHLTGHSWKKRYRKNNGKYRKHGRTWNRKMEQHGTLNADNKEISRFTARNGMFHV
jgi:hypothetical protein